MLFNFKMNWKLARGKKAMVSISTGNRKLVSNKETRFLIWNLPARKTCPFATLLCLLFCYAIKAEKNYPDCLPARERNFNFSKSKIFVPFMVQMIHYICSLKAYRTAKRIVFRWHESGDFYSQKYTNDCLDIMRQCYDIPNLIFMAYTKSAPFFEGKQLPKNFVLRGSIWSDTKPEQEKLLRQYPVYTVCNEEDFKKLPEKQKCHCDDCGHCNKCWLTRENIQCVQH